MKTNKPTDNAIKILRTIQDEGYVTYSRLAEVTNLPERTVNRLCLKLKTAKIICIKRGPKGGCYFDENRFPTTMLQVIQLFDPIRIADEKTRSLILAALDSVYV